MPAVTVVIPTYNRRALLEETVGSVEAQTFKDWELVVVDDASTDDTPNWLERIQNDRIRWLRQEDNAGESAARNRGMREAASSFLLFLDDDDLLRPEALARLVGQAEKARDVLGVIGGAKLFDLHGNSRKITHVWWPRRRVIWPDVLLGWVPIIAATLFRKEALLQVQGFDEGIRASEDVELFLRLGRGGRFLLLPHVVADKRAHPGQVKFLEGARVQGTFKARFRDTLTGRDKERARRLIGVAGEWRDADASYHSGDPRSALKGFVKTGRSSEPWRSPIRRAYLAKDIGKAALASLAVTLLGRKMTERLRSLTRQVSSKLLKRRPISERKVWGR